MFDHAIDSMLTVHTLREKDAEELFLAVDENRAHLREWLPWLDANTKVEHTRRFIHAALQQEERGNGFVCAIRFEGRIVGVIGYNWIRRENRSAEIGYWLGRDAMGRGIMTRCCRALVEHAFGVLDLNRVTIPVAAENVRSRAIPERLGFRMEGVLRESEWLYDHFVDHVLYSALRRGWDHKQGRCVE